MTFDLVKYLAHGLGNVEMYHGSSKKMGILEPNSINMGTKFSKPRWSIFLWNDKERAYNWAIYSVFREVFKQKREEGWTKKDHDFLYDPVSGKIYVQDIALSDWRKALNGKSIYLYTVKVPMMDLDIGHAKDIEEYTIDTPTKYTSVDELNIDDRIFRLSTIIAPDTRITRAKLDMAEGRIKPNLLRRFLGATVMHDDYFDDFNNASRGLHTGELKPGDDIRKYLDSL
jgi:hypothetical protein